MNPNNNSDRFNSSYAQDDSGRKIFRLVIAGSILLLVILALQWLWNHSYIQITLANSQSGNVDLQIVNPDSRKEFKQSTNTRTIRKLVSRGTHQITIRQNDTSYFTTVKSPGFLRTASVNATLAKEKQRQFVGNNPKPCAENTGSITITWQCSGQFTTAVIHRAATPSLPTYIIPFKGLAEADVETIMTRNGRQYVITRSSSGGDGAHTLHALDPATANIIPGSRRILSELNGSLSYSSVPYKEGTLLYSQESTDMFYYPSPAAPAVKIQTAAAKANDLKLYSVSTFGDAVVSVYNQHIIAEDPSRGFVQTGNILSEETNEEEDEGTEIAHGHKIIGKTEIVITNNGQNSTYTLDEVATQVRLCAANILCALQSDKLHMYDIQDGKLKPKQVITGVRMIENSSTGLLMVTKLGVLLYDTTRASGHYQYTFDEYSFCGLYPYRDRFVLCIETEGKDMLLSINQKSDNVDSIDKKVRTIAKMPEVKEVSINGTNIFITPNISKREYRTDINGFGYNPQEQAKVKSAIERAVKDAGINTGTYYVKPLL